MKSIKYLLIVSILILIGVSFSSCSNARLRTSAGVDVHFGPHGPRVDPHINVGVYNGGRF